MLTFSVFENGLRTWSGNYAFFKENHAYNISSKYIIKSHNILTSIKDLKNGNIIRISYNTKFKI